MSRDIEAAIVPACRELGIGIVAYAPLARGLLTGTLAAAPHDYRGVSPRFSAANLDANLALVAALKAVAAARGCTTAQVALAWVHSRGDDVVPIPGTTTVKTLASNVAAAAIDLTDADLAAIEQACPAEAVQGGRYANDAMTYLGNKLQ
jgi:aryl-alcohol dehydrogenase-like predicted oxidoreductase